jgi:hypothetical protein
MDAVELARGHPDTLMSRENLAESIRIRDSKRTR